LEIALDHASKISDRKVTRIVSIRIRVGELNGIVDEWMGQYFTYASRGTLAEGARLDTLRLPIIFECSVCGHQFPLTVPELSRPICPRCSGEKAKLISGSGFFIDGIEVAFDE
jgi:hydrogenase nickel incorporation protein HypA/HybF